MKMYAVKNDQGKWLCIEANGSHYWSRDDGDFFDQHDADTLAHVYGGQVVPLIEDPAKVVVSADEAEMLERAKVAAFPAHIFDSGAAGSLPGSQDRLMRAYVNGWTVKKPKRYVLPMHGTEYHNIQMHGNAQYYAIKGTENWRPDAIALGTDDAVKHGYTVTQADIDAAPGWVKAITPVEVTDDEQ